MPVKYFVSQDSLGREQAPDYSHETLAVINIIKETYSAFHHCQNLYAVIANLNKKGANADLVVVTERGLGVTELKHYSGCISRKGPIWYADSHPIPGSENVGYRNPHEQVQIYTNAIRNSLIEVSQTNIPCLPGNYAVWKEFKFGTAVCFTNPEAKINDFRNEYHRYLTKSRKLKTWEQFAILTPDEISNWVAALRFEVNKGYAHHFEKYRFTARQIMQIVMDVFDATKWKEIDRLMPVSKPYAYLLLKENRNIDICFGLNQEKITIGRKAICEITIPEHYKRVSKQHAKIRRSANGIFIEDKNSTNGTFINDERIVKSARLQAGQQITLGGKMNKSDVCLLEFSLEPPKLSSTIVNTDIREPITSDQR